MVIHDYLAYSRLPFEEYEEVCRRIIKQDDIGADDFYAQPFKPELITKYFKGWTEKGDGRYVNGCWTISLRCRNMLIIRRSKKGKEMWAALLPETLNDFIRDCERVGIKLEAEENANF